MANLADLFPYAAEEKAEGEAAVGVEEPKNENTARFASGDKVSVAVKEETYEGTLTDKNEDGTWEVQTDSQVTLHRVPEDAIQIGGKDSMMLPASKRGTAMKELVASLEKLTAAVVKAERVGDVETTEEFWDCECPEDFQHPKAEETCPKCKASRDSQPDSHVNELPTSLTASIFDDVEELDLGGGYIARRKKAGKKEDKAEEKPEEKKEEPKP